MTQRGVSSTEGYGRELFESFVPSSARARVAARPGAAKALLSGALVARNAPSLAGPVIEVTWPGRAALSGILRAARHDDLVVAVSVPAAVRAGGPQASRAVVDEILAAADVALFDRPLILVARAMPLAKGASVERLSEGLYRDLEAGFTSMAFSSAAFQGDVDELVRVTAPLVEQELGLELELNDGEPGGDEADPALLLARVDDAGLSLAAVRGARHGDELGAALLVIPSAQATGSLAPAKAATPLRIVLDDALARSLARGSGDDERLEASLFMDTAEICAKLGARGTSTRLLDALASTLR